MIDTHAHIDDEQYQERLDDFIREQQQGGVEAILVPGVDETNVDAVRQVCEKYPGYLYPAIGLHPENVTEHWQDQLAMIHNYLGAHVAIGEIGLDYHFSTEYKQAQHKALRTQLQWALDEGLPVMLHVRDATEDALNILRPYCERGLRGVMHCWSGSNEVAHQIIQMGLYLGIGGIITFKNCKLREHLTDIPLERLVLETDAPYMAPVPHRGERNESRWMVEVMQVLSQVYECSVEHIDAVTTANAKQLFGIK